MSSGVVILGESRRSIRSLGEALVVDDDPVVLAILEKALTGFGYLVMTASHARNEWKDLLP